MHLTHIHDSASKAGSHGWEVGGKETIEGNVVNEGDHELVRALNGENEWYINRFNEHLCKGRESKGTSASRRLR